MNWTDPPPKRRGRNLAYDAAPKGTMSDWVKGLSQRPGQWAKYPHPHRASNSTHYGRRYPNIEFTERRNADDWYDLYGRTRT